MGSITFFFFFCCFKKYVSFFINIPVEASTSLSPFLFTLGHMVVIWIRVFGFRVRFVPPFGAFKTPCWDGFR